METDRPPSLPQLRTPRWSERALTFARNLPARLPARLRPPKLSTAHWIWIGAGVALALFFMWMSWPRAQNVEAALIDRGEVRRDVVDEGRTRIHDVFVLAAPVGGALQRIELEPGDAVQRGQVVAVIAPADPALLDARVAGEAQASVTAAEASVHAAQASLDLARRDQQRTAALHQRGFAAQASLDSANASLRAARAELAARQADLSRARIAASGSGARAEAATPVRSPASGRVLRMVQESQTVVAAGSQLMQIGDPGDLEILAEFLSEDVVLMRPGARAFVENWGGEGQIPAHIVRIEPDAHTKVSALGVEEQRVNVIAHLDSPQTAPPLGNGYRVDLRVVVSDHPNVLRVPVDALVRDGEGWSVFKIVHGRARLTRVAVSDGGEHYRAVSGGLDDGDQIVMFPGDALKDGDYVRAGRRE